MYNKLWRLEIGFYISIYKENIYGKIFSNFIFRIFHLCNIYSILFSGNEVPYCSFILHIYKANIEDNLLKDLKDFH